MKKLLVIAALAFSAFTLDSCGPGRYTVSTQPIAPRYERPISPGSGYVWVDGDWYWSGGKYAYRNGYWVKPKSHHRVYVSGTWVRSGNGWYWKRGYWQ